MSDPMESRAIIATAVFTVMYFLTVLQSMVNSADIEGMTEGIIP